MLSHAMPLFAQTATQEMGSAPWYVNLAVAIAVLVVSFLLGDLLGKRFRMPEHGWKIGVCLFATLASVAILLLGPKLKLGIDLRGGVLLVYEVDQSKLKSGEDVDMSKLVAAVTRRINPGGQKEVLVRAYGKQQVEVVDPDVDEAEVARLKQVISRTGTLEFRILATQRANKALIERAMAEPSKMQITNSRGELLAWWVPVRKKEQDSFRRDAEIAIRERKHGKDTIMEVLVVKDIYDVTGAYLSSARTGADPKTGRPCVEFSFNNRGAQLFGRLTGDHLPDEQTNFAYRLGIILDDEMCSAPTIQSQISDNGVITGNFSQEEVQDLVNILNAGSLPAALAKEPLSELYSGPTLGNDTITKSTHAMIIACLLVPAFMLWYYRFCGIVADIALVLNMLMLFAVMLSVKAAFTLTGFAGLALTVGMAVDNNILVFERLREERQRGATLRMAIRNAFHRATTTIVDCNLTHLIAAVVMFYLGTEQIRGFAITLGIGVTISIFTSVFVSHVIFDVAEKRQWISDVKMRHIIGHTNYDFMHWFRYCLAGSIIVIVLAIVVAFHRGKGLFDIDFTGGVSVQVAFNEPQATAKVRDALKGKLADLAISDVRLAGQTAGLQFVVNTSEPDMKKVEKVLQNVFGKKLARNELNFTEPKAIVAAERQRVLPDVKVPDEPGKPAKPAPNKPAKTSQIQRGHDWLALDGASEGLWSVEDKTPAQKPAVKKSAKETSAAAHSEKPAPRAKPSVETPPAKPPVSEGPSIESEQAMDKEDAGGAMADTFVGGTEADLTFTRKVNHQNVLDLLANAMEAAGIKAEGVRSQVFNKAYVEGDKTPFATWKLKTTLSPDKTKQLLTALQRDIAERPVFPAANTIGAAVAGNTQLIAIYALVVSWLCIIVYLWVRFQGVAFGLAAVIALIHDVLVMLGAIAVSYYIAPFFGWLEIEPFKINLPIVAAFLTIIGYSVNDTIVVFDRIREVRGKDPDLTRKMVNDSTNQTLSRTLLTSLTVLLVVVVLYFAGGEALHGFAFSLIAGVLTGTYSSIYIAAPILLWLVGKHKQLSKQLSR